MIELWLLARSWEIPALQNRVLQAIDGVSEKCKEFPVACLDPAYEVIRRGSQLRQYLVSLYIHCYDPSRFTYNKPKLPHGFLVDVIQYLGKNVTIAQRKHDVAKFFHPLEQIN